MVRKVFRRLERLEARVLATRPAPLVIRVLLVHPEKGVTGVLVIESDKPTATVAPTAEEIEQVRADLDRRRMARLPGKGDANDTHDCAPD